MQGHSVSYSVGCTCRGRQRTVSKPLNLYLARNRFVHSQMTIYGIGGAAFLLHILALLRMPVAYLAIVRQECRTSYQFLLNAQIPRGGFGDLATGQYSFVVKRITSRHLSVRRKTPPPCRGGGPKGRRGFPCTRVTLRPQSQNVMKCL